MTIKLSLVALFAFPFLMTFSSCGEPEEMENTDQVLPFELEGKWNFINIAAEGKVGGAPQSDEDTDPMGYVEFYSDGNGYSDFNIDLLGFNLTKDENIQWERIGNTIDIEEEDGAHEIWTLLDTDSTNIKAVWSLSFGSLNQADFTMKLEKE